jgi:RNA binding exosome subunit
MVPIEEVESKSGMSLRNIELEAKLEKMKKLKKFLATMISRYNENLTTVVKRVIFLLKEVLCRNEMYIIDERAITLKTDDYHSIFKKISTFLPKSTIILIKNN